jgi:tetratricopeptide (TPR) repeat protein
MAKLLVAGEAALTALDEATARRAFRSALRLEPGNSAALEGLRRVRLIAGVRPLLEDARRAEASRDLLRAAQGYAQALALDQRQAAARAGIARVRRAAGPDAFMRSLVDAHAALGSGQLEAAKRGFERAVALRADDSRAVGGLARADAALTARRLAPLLRKAALLEENGDWAEALRAYEEILRAEPGYVLAQQGRQRAALRAGAAPVQINVATGNAMGNANE